MPDTNSQDRITALESMVERLAGEVAVLQDTLRVSQARIAKLEELVAHRPGRWLYDDPFRADSDSIITTRFVYQSRDLKLLSLPIDVLHIVIEHVATVNRLGDDDDYSLPSRFAYTATALLISLSCTSKEMQQLVKPALWRHIEVDSPARILRLTKAVKNSAYGFHVRSIRWQPEGGGPYTLGTVRAAVLDLSEDASAAPLPPFDSATFLLTKDQSIMFAAQIMAVALRDLTALQALSIEGLLLSVILSLRPEGHLPNHLTHVSVTQVSDMTRTEKVLSQNTFIATQTLQMLGPSHRDVFDQFQREPQQRQFRPLESSWSGKLSLHTGYDRLMKNAGDAAMAISTLQTLLNSAVRLHVLYFFSDGKARIRLETVIPFVKIPTTLKIVHIHEGSNSALDFVVAMSHIRSIQYLRIVYCASNLAPKALPPSLTVLKLKFDGVQSSKTVASILRSLRRNLQDDRYPKTLTYICLESTSLSTLTSQHTLASALSAMCNKSTIDADLPGLTSLLAAVLALDDACRDRGIKLCGSRTSKPLLKSSFRETLPYKLMGQVIAKLNSMESGAAA